MTKINNDWIEKITITLEGHGVETSFSTSSAPLTTIDLLEWFEYQVLPAIGYSSINNKVEQLDD